MATYAYEGFDSDGAKQSGLIEASDLKQAREQLLESGILASSLSPAGLTKKHRFSWFPGDFPIAERSKLYRELQALVSAGLPLDKSLDLLIQTPDRPGTARVLAAARDRIKEGSSFAEALTEASSSFGPHEKAVIAAGERAGALESVLERLACFMEEQDRLRQSIITALAYPILVLIIAAAMAIGLLGFAAPRIGQLLSEESGLTLPLITRAVIWLGGFLVRWGLILLAALIAVIGFAVRRIKTDQALRLRTDSAVFDLPIIGRGYSLLVNFRFARTLSLLLAGDGNLTESVSLAGAATGSAWVAKLSEEASESIRHGASLSGALRRIPPLAGTLARWTQVGEAGGQLPQLLESAGARLQMRWESYISRLTRMLEPLLIVAVSIFVLIVVLAILLPILSLNTLL